MHKIMVPPFIKNAARAPYKNYQTRTRTTFVAVGDPFPGPITSWMFSTTRRVGRRRSVIPPFSWCLYDVDWAC